MASTLGRNLNRCFSKNKAPASASPQSSLHHQDHSRSLSNSTPASILINNFNSLYDFTFHCTTHSKSFGHSDDDDYDLSVPESDTDDTTAPDFATVFASQRFFFSSPGRSNSIIDSSSSSLSSLASTTSSSDSIVGGSIAVPTYSPDPFIDFRRSMQEMVEAHDLIDVRANWEYLHELLMCYLSLNPKSTHKFIVGAFADLLVSLMTSSPEQDSRRNRKSNFSGISCCKISRG
ncbi:hypothetical protein ACH5RR_010652 [Cinchona calisaya]|uniref:Transcription repressor n=1 Tax=Cinchona calisaya TaxID=153742 RepID=A0ABD3AJJ4_9GENT